MIPCKGNLINDIHEVNQFQLQQSFISRKKRVTCYNILMILRLITTQFTGCSERRLFVSLTKREVNVK